MTFNQGESSEVIENESVHKTAEEWEEGKWGYFEEFCQTGCLALISSQIKKSLSLLLYSMRMINTYQIVKIHFAQYA